MQFSFQSLQLSLQLSTKLELLLFFKATLHHELTNLGVTIG